jgi:iron(II)-dependent oxidoreductase
VTSACREPREAVTGPLVTARLRTLSLCDDVGEASLRAQFDPLFSPLGWHLGHVAWQEEMWLLRHYAGRPPLFPELDAVFDAFDAQKSERGSKLPRRPDLFDYCSRVRQGVERLCEARGDEPRLLGLLRFVANHERQHSEIMGIVRLLGGLFSPRPEVVRPEPAPRSSRGIAGELVEVGARSFMLGSDDDPDGWDNERRAHRIELEAFLIGRFPVTAGDWLAFMDAGGYADDRAWSTAGAAWRRSSAVTAPLFWSRDTDGRWWRRSLAGPRPVRPDEPVCHVSWYEAEAYASFVGARLPSEAEWEAAASSDDRSAKRRWPWGSMPPAPEHAACAPGAVDVAPVGTHPRGRAASGAEDMVGNVWEWVGDAFRAYPGFEPQDYARYSQPWFDGRHRVARGGSYLSQPEIARCCFRNWYTPEFRQPPLGLRLAKSGAAT